MADHAAVAAGAALRVDHIDLDFTANSLAAVDGTLGRFHDEGLTPSQIGETLFSFGAYIGEVIVREQGARWVDLPREHLLGNDWPMVDMPDERFWNPIGKAFKRVENGDQDSVVYFYAVLTTSLSHG
jgi:hypothetical protein